jgi:Fuc2NAc and GlcNAc transferase
MKALPELLRGICREAVKLPVELVFVAAATLFASATLTLAVRRAALARGLLDVPNARSSHSVPTPRGGGLAIVLAATGGFLALYALHALPTRLLVALCGGGIAVAAVGFIDDRGALPARIRIAVHIAAAIWAVIWLGGLPALRTGSSVMELGWTGDVLAVLGVVWTLNLFNFMDGIDGIAASEAIIVSAGGGSLMLSAGLPPQVPAAALVFAAACSGFLPWNWPRARIFMGDVGSGYLGYTIAVLAIAATGDSPVFAWVWLLLGGAFFVDATVTLARRILRGEQPHVAHRSHAYQWLARRWGSHRPVTLAVIAVNMLWLLPSAWLAANYPPFALWILAGAFAPLIIVAIAAGAGRQERPAQ